MAFLARLGRFRRLQRDLVARAQGDVALAFDVGAFKRQIAACVQLHALLAADVTDLGGAAAVFAAAGAAAEAGAEVFAVGGEAALRRGLDVKTAVVFALLIAGLIEANIAAGVDGGFTAAAVQRGALIDRVLFHVNVDAAGRVDRAGHRLAGAAVAALGAAFAFGVHGQIAAGGGVDAYAGAAAGVAVLLFLAVRRGFAAVAVRCQRDRAFARLILRALIAHFACGVDVDAAGFHRADHRLRAAAAFFAAAALCADIQADVRRADAADVVDDAGGVQLGRLADRALDRTGHGAVIDVGADVHADVGFGGAAAGGVGSGQMIDAGGVLLVGAADAVLRALLGQLVAGVDSQVAFNVAAGGDRLAAMRLRFAVLVAGFHAAAELVDAAGVVETAADLGLLGVRGGFIVGRQERDLVTADAGIAFVGDQFGAAEGHVLLRLELHAAAAEGRGAVFGAGGFFAVAGVFDAQTGTVLLVAGFFGVAVDGKRGLLLIDFLLLFGGLDVDVAGLRRHAQLAAAGDLAADDVGILTADQLQVGVRLQFAGGAALVAVVGLVRTAGDVEGCAGARVDFVHGGAQRVVDAQAALRGGDQAAFLAARLAAGDGDALLAVQAQGAVAGQFGGVADLAAIAVVFVVAAADAAPGGFVIAHRFGVGGFLHPNLDLVAGIDRQIAAGVQLGALGRDVVTGLQRQRPLAAQFTGLQAFAFVAAAPAAGAQAGRVVALIAALGGLILLYQPGEVHVARRLDAQRPIGADVGAQQVHVFPGTDEFGAAAGGDGAACLLLLLALTGDVILPGVEPAVVGVALGLFQLLTVERQLAALQRDVFAANIGGGEVRVVIRHQADVLAFQLGAGQLLAAAAVVDVDAAAVVLVVVAAVAVAAGIVNAAFAANIVGFHLEIVAGGQRARQLHAAALCGVDDVDAPGLHAAEVVAVQRGGRLYAGQHLAVARHAVMAADGVDRRRRHAAVAVGEVLYDHVTAAVYLRCDQVQHAAGAQGTVEAQGIAVAQGAVALQQAVLDQRVADHQRGAAGVDEPAALTADAVRVGQHVVGSHAEDLLLAMQ